MEQRTALVVGATGLIGQFLVKKLEQQPEYKKIYLFVRRDMEVVSEKTEVRVVSFDLLEEKDFPQVDDVYCCLGTTIKKAKTKEAFKQVDYEYPLKIARAALKKGAKQFLVVSAIGANETSRFFYSRVKGEVEKAVMNLAYAHIHIFRPSLLLGKRQEVRIGEKIGEWGAKLAKPWLRGPFAKYRAISGEQVAQVMVARALTKTDQPVLIYESNEMNSALK
ncbi:oxidoreductase [Halalkalibacter okhensis]|uniref:Oxidoreductase n=1 Tax=Halalkalibacter okhensis TaxID=333138 RepID=A0A0B0IA11_9BACI|nr:oxidoreductase [Halalkalibacter okhensis]KHF38135.1 oxidoreductase [Halalkalibacter okhensis]